MKTNKNQYTTYGQRLTAERRLALIRRMARVHGLTQLKLALLTGYSLSTVHGWFSNCTSARHRRVTAKAIDRLLLELPISRKTNNKSARG
ncbi:hypothetical protein PS726_00157 [Pseudomonas fluorescens]|uniref:hypothetical protein n=1 Tax=Pseudomonas fluorescens TaxID=294 RepID=UPI00123F5374|nr:hypothetical protein [Pseudomonas fluorescens]VVN66989.1 hypothetical protein PS726_00157 [Pseudomonas fluorescens]